MFSPALAQTDEFEQGMGTMWEVLWHQSGTPTRVVRWEQDLRVRILGVNPAAHQQHPEGSAHEESPPKPA